MKKFLLSIALVVAATFSASAQFRVEALGDFATYKFKANSTTESTKAEFGFSARGFYRFLEAGEDGSVEVGLGYMMSRTSNNNVLADREMTIHNLQVPIHGNWDFQLGNTTLTISLGFYLGYSIDGKTVIKNQLGEVSNNPFDGDGGLKKFDFGNDDELYFTFGGHYNVGVGFQWSFLNLCKDSNVKTSYDNCWFSLGYTF